MVLAYNPSLIATDASFPEILHSSCYSQDCAQSLSHYHGRFCCTVPFNVAVPLKEPLVYDSYNFVQNLSAYILSHSYFRIFLRVEDPSSLWSLTFILSFQDYDDVNPSYCQTTEFLFHIYVRRGKISRMITHNFYIIRKLESMQDISR